MPVCRVARRVALGDVVAVADGAIAPGPAKKARGNMAPRGCAWTSYEDDYLLALDKPAGVVCIRIQEHNWHGDDASVAGARVASARTPVDGRPSRKLTSGIVLVAKTAAAHAGLQRAMAARDADKTTRRCVRARERDERRDRFDCGGIPATAGEWWRLNGRRRAKSHTRVAAPDSDYFARAVPLVTGRTHRSASIWRRAGSRLLEIVYGGRGGRRSAILDLRRAQTFAGRSTLLLALTHPVTRTTAAQAPVPRPGTSGGATGCV
jgi:23S rRNA-/tRNA-specific pseudouridylate synthase